MHSAVQPGTSSKVNLTFLHTVCDGDAEFMASIVQTFVEDAPQILQRLVDHAKNCKWTEVGLAAHQLKPSLQFIGLKETLSLVQTIERSCAENDDIPSVPGLVSVVAHDISQAIVELQHYLSDSKS